MREVGASDAEDIFMFSKMQKIEALFLHFL